MTINAQYNVAAPESLPIKFAGYQRRKMYARFIDTMDPGPDDTILDIGATSDQTYEHSNYLEAWYPHKAKVTACGIDDATFLERKYPGMTFRQADGRKLPFADGSFDYVHSSAVLEHVGSFDNQAAFIAEMWRVARKGIFATTPNRWFPVEFHTVLPLVHWLPKPAFRALLRAIGKGFFADENNLNLMSAGSLARAAGQRAVRVESEALAGWPTNLLLIGRKSG